jgi:hypothetical protein
VGQQLGRSPHVVVDLADVTFLGARAVQALHALHEQAQAAGTRLHLAAEHDAVRRPLHLAGLDELVPVCAAADAVVAEIAFGMPSTWRRPGRAEQSDAVPAPAADELRRLLQGPPTLPAPRDPRVRAARSRRV